jgi:hypothetical protein
MALEMVSPPQKFNQETLSLTAFSVDGGRALFKSKAALAGTEGLQTFVGDSYVASRESSGWGVTATSLPRQAKIIGGGGAAAGGPYAFSSNLNGWLSFGCTQAQRKAGEGQAFLAGMGNSFSLLSPVLIPIDDTVTEILNGGANLATFCTSLTPRAAASDLSATILPASAASTAYLPEDPRGIGDGNTNRYVAFLDSAGQPALQLLGRDRTGKVWGGRCGSRLGGEGALNQGAISTDGSRIFFSTRPAQTFDPTKASEPTANPACATDSSHPLRILERIRGAAGEGPEITELIPGGPAAGSDFYQGASTDGSKVFFTTSRTLATSDLDSSIEECSPTLGASHGCDLYLYDSSLLAGERLIQVSAGGSGDPEPGKGANVLSSIAAISSDGSHVYFVAQGVLTTAANPEGAVAVPGQPNLYLYQRDAAHPDGRTAFVGTLASGDKGALWGSNASLATGGAYPVPLLRGGGEEGDGHTLFIVSEASLTPDDADEGHTDVFRYESEAEALQCVSCAPGGPDAMPLDVFAGSSDSTPSPNFAELGRWASDDGRIAAFATAEPLLSGDSDGTVTSYLWREGQLVMLPGTVTEPVLSSKLPTVSSGGEEVGFTTTARLLPQDGDTARDAYVVRTDGGFPNPISQSTCDPLVAGSCQGAPTRPGSDPGTATGSFIGPGNAPPPRPKCRRGTVRRHGKCVGKRHRKMHVKKHSRQHDDGRAHK